MATFDVDKVCWRIVHDPDFYAAVLAAPEDALRDTGLDDEEREALLAGNVKRLYERGVNPFLMEHLANWGAFGLDHASFSASMREAEWRSDA